MAVVVVFVLLLEVEDLVVAAVMEANLLFEIGLGRQKASAEGRGLLS